MKPSYALNLSPDGISLLRRAAGGWRRVDEVALTDPELLDKLKIMRGTAASLENGRMSSKLVIPNSQILYTNLAAPGPTDAERFEQIKSQLDGMTPYDVEDLVFDWNPKGDRCEVAAVARETLGEAEAFATEHKFNPVSMVSIPPSGSFSREPYFGLTKEADRVLEDGDTLEKDIEPIVVLRETVQEKPPAPVEPVTPTKTDFVAPKPSPAPAAEATAPVPPKPKPEKARGFGVARTSSDAAPKLGFAKRAKPPDPAPAPQQTADKPPTTAPSTSEKPTPDAPAPAVASTFHTRRSADASKGDVPEPTISAAPSRISFVPVEQAPEKPKAAPKRAPLPPLPKPRFRKKAAKKADPAPPAPVAATAEAGETAPPQTDPALAKTKEAQALTIFGARKKSKAKTRGKPRFLGLILTVVLLLFLALVALWSNIFLEGGVAGLFRDPGALEEPTDIATLAPELAEAVEDEDNFSTASLQPEPDEPILRAPVEETAPEVVPVPPLVEAPPEPRLPDLQTARNFYAANGIWRLPPQDFQPPDIEQALEDLYIASIDPASVSHDAVALHPVDPNPDEPPLRSPSPPAPFGTEFDLGTDGLVAATPDGALTPEGIRVFAGKPVLVPAPRPEPPEGFVSSPEDEAVVLALPNTRPRLRPDNLVERNERGRFRGRSLEELAGIRPKERPASPQIDEAVNDAPTQFAVASSRSPKSRPSDIAKIVETARTRAPEAAAVQTAATAPQSVAPKIPTRASVARRATVPNAINLKRVNLIGVYGTPSDRRALVRLPSGRYVKVSVGDRVDGGKVAAIGKADLRYVKRGKNITLKMPSS